MSVVPEVDHSSAGAEYRAARLRMAALAANLDAETASRVVAACPAWTVRDLFSHVTGIAVDLSQGNRPQGDPSRGWIVRWPNAVSEPSER